MQRKSHRRLPPLPKFTPIDRLEKQLVGKFFHFVYANGTRFRAGRIETILDDTHFIVRYLRDGKLQKWTHIVRPYDRPDIESLTGYWLHDSQADLLETYNEFLRDHMEEQLAKSNPEPAKAEATEVKS